MFKNQYKINKNSVLWNYPEIFKQLIWKNGVAIITAIGIDGDNYITTQSYTNDKGLNVLLKVPKNLCY